MPAFAFTADDAALAVSMMISAEADDVEFTTMPEYDAACAAIAARCRGLVTDVSKLHGINALGDATLGDDEAASELVAAAQSFSKDPSAYLDSLADAGAAPDLAPTSPQADAGIADTAEADLPNGPIASPQPAAPVMALATAVLPTPSIRMVPRMAKDLFPSISPLYHGVMIPTAVWDSPKPDLPAINPHFHFEGFHVSVLSSALQERTNIMSVGDPGCGKTEFYMQAAARLGLPCHKIPMDGSLTRSEIIGSFRQVATPNGSETPFVHGRIPRAIQQPCLIVLDEIDQADPDLMYMLHPVLEGGGLVIEELGGEVIPRHPHCYIVATANTKGRGSENGLTHMKYEMSEATRDRFGYWLEFTFLREEKEVEIITKTTALSKPLAEKMVTVANAIRTAYANGNLSQTCSLRQMLDAAPLFNAFSSRGDETGLALALDTVMAARANREDALAIREFVNQNLAVDLTVIER